MESPQYTTILYRVKRKLKLTANEYLIADSIDKLSNNAKFQWCEATRKELANFQGISRRSVISIIQRLEKKGLIEINEQTKGLRTTKKWIEIVVLEKSAKIAHRVKKLHPQGEETSQQQSEETSPPSYNSNNSNNSNNNVKSVVNYFFELKGWADKDKEFYQKKKIIYSRFTRPAKELLYLCEDNLEEAKECLKKVANWAMSRELDWSIETIFKKWYDIDLLKPKDKKPYYRNNRVFEMGGRKYVLMPNGEKMEFAGNINEIIYK